MIMLQFPVWIVLPLGSWAPLGDDIYHVSPNWTARTYQDARKYCNELGGELAQPQTEYINVRRFSSWN